MISVLKIGGELLETRDDVSACVRHVQRAKADGQVVVVHGGGRELSSELARRGATPAMVDGIRITDDEALAAAVSVLGGTINTRLVAALIAAGVPAVGLTGVDGGILRVTRTPPVRSRSGGTVDLGHVGTPVHALDVSLLVLLCRSGWVPAVASLGVTQDGKTLNVNADVAASHLAIALRASRLVVLGATDGVYDANGRTIDRLTEEDVATMIASGAARDGMAAKLRACATARASGVGEVRILHGRSASLASGGTEIARAPAAKERVS